MFTIPGSQLPDCLRRDNLTSPYFPSLTRAGLAAVVTLCAIFALTSFNRLNHTDLWGHLDFGRWIVQHQALPTHDPFSAAPTSAPVLNAAWLSQVIGYGVHSTFGNEGLVFGHALLVTLTAGAVMLAVARRGIDGRFAVAAGAAMFLLELPIAGTIRPQLFGQLGAALVLLACSELPTKRHPLLWLPVVGMLWANLHGSILIGLAILGSYALSITFQVLRETGFSVAASWKEPRIVTMAAAVLLLLAGACINPHGPLLLPRILFFGEHAALAYISEWKAMAPASLTGVLLIGSLLVAACLWKYGGRTWELHDYLLLALFALATLSAIRMLAWYAIVWPWIVLPHAARLVSGEWLVASGRPSTDDHSPLTTHHSPDEPAAMRTLIAMGCVFATAILAPPTYSLVTGNARGEVPVASRETPVHLADQIERLNLSGKVAAPMDWADYLIYTSQGRLKPLIYGHIHLSRVETFEDYRRIFRGEETWLRTLQNHDVRYLLVSRERFGQLAKLVSAESRAKAGRVRVVYHDQKAILAELMPTRELDL
ncbi:MAG TPA: hypothetical protein VMP01_17120 [Pirellulaceae bacterium]|nr:hypothetical protein [Pirellulaceae bacterium]